MHMPGKWCSRTALPDQAIFLCFTPVVSTANISSGQECMSHSQSMGYTVDKIGIATLTHVLDIYLRERVSFISAGWTYRPLDI